MVIHSYMSMSICGRGLSRKAAGLVRATTRMVVPAYTPPFSYGALDVDQYVYGGVRRVCARGVVGATLGVEVQVDASGCPWPRVI